MERSDLFFINPGRLRIRRHFYGAKLKNLQIWVTSRATILLWSFLGDFEFVSICIGPNIKTYRSERHRGQRFFSSILGDFKFVGICTGPNSKTYRSEWHREQRFFGESFLADFEFVGICTGRNSKTYRSGGDRQERLLTCNLVVWNLHHTFNMQ